MSSRPTASPLRAFGSIKPPRILEFLVGYLGAERNLLECPLNLPSLAGLPLYNAQIWSRTQILLLLPRGAIYPTSLHPDARTATTGKEQSFGWCRRKFKFSAGLAGTVIDDDDMIPIMRSILLCAARGIILEPGSRSGYATDSGSTPFGRAVFGLLGI